MTTLPATTASNNFGFNTTIRPGFLVAIKTAVSGNVTYDKREVEAEKIVDGVARAKWETERTIKDAAEQEAASKVRSKARSLIASICSVTDFGYLCPLIAKADLDKAIAEARTICDAFNASSTVTKIRFGAITGTIAQDDYAAVRAIRREVAELLTDMQQGLQALDVKTVREAAARAKQLGQMLTPDAQVRVELAIKAARDLATKINAAGDQGAAEIDRATIARLNETRTAFLDLDAPTEEIGTSFTPGRAVDLVPTEGSKVDAAGASPARAVELN